MRIMRPLPIGRTSVVKILMLGKPAWIASGICVDDLGRHRALEHHVEAVVGVALAPDLLLVRDGLRDRQARLPDREVDERRRPAVDRGAADLLGRRARR